MRIEGTMVITLETGEKALLLLAKNKIEQDELYQHLSVDAYKFKKEVSEEEPEIKFISAGFRNEDEVFWNENYIPVPKWYDMN
ncbi:MAG: hypothetical protein EOP00_17205 [Pedobacter sp.]|nr:MAG: hypothetical protein EOP00_17205 [Pedobacter sp.]